MEIALLMGPEMVEAVARIIDPVSFKSWQASYDYEMKASGNAEEARSLADWSVVGRVSEAKTKAADILAALASHPAPAASADTWDVIAKRLRTETPDRVLMLKGAIALEAMAEELAEALAKPASDASPSGEPTPAGWKLVPEVPTEEMMQAGLYQASHDAEYADVCQSWMDMWRIAPEPDATLPAPAATEMVEAAQGLRDLEDSVLACESGTMLDVLANYRTVRRTVQDLRAALAASPAPAARGGAQSDIGIPTSEQNQSLEVVPATCAKNAQVQPAPAATETEVTR